MKRVKKTIRSLVMLVLVCAMLTTLVFAADDDNLWLNTAATSTDEQTDAWLVTDTTITDGQVELHYNSAALTYESVEVNEAYVAMYSVNAETEGVVKIAWVTYEAYEAEDAIWLVKASFAGKGEISASGAVNGGQDGEFAILTVEELQKAILEAEGLYEDNYTPISYDTLEKALAMAKEVLADPTATQSQVNAAAETLNNGIASLELKLFTNNAELYKAILRAQGLCEDRYTAESWAALEEALANANAVMNDRNATQREIDEAASALNAAIDALELKTEEPDVPDDSTNPSEPAKDPDKDKGSWLDKIKKWIGGWFKPGKPSQTEPTETTIPETSVPATSEPAEKPGQNGGFFDWIKNWFSGWRK